MELKSTIGYAGLDAVNQMKSEEQEFDTCILRVAAMKNKNGRTVMPSTDGALAAVRSRAAAFLDSSCPGFGLCADVYDGPDADVWPLSTLTYLVIPTNTTDEEEGCDKMKTVYDYVKWIITDSEAANIAKEQMFSTMPRTIADHALAIMDEMQCKDADGVVRLIKDRPTSADTLDGEGSSLQGYLQTKLTNAYFQQSFTSIAYTSSSSGTGRDALRNFQVSFAGSDSILDMDDPEFIRRQVKMIPAFSTAVAIIYNLDGADDLVLTREAVAGIFTGSITAWNNPAISSENIDAFLTNEAIVRVVRSTKSGTTSALTTAIYSFAGLPGGAALDYSQHVLKGSSLPDWPVPALPYADGASCQLRNCIKQVCEPGERLDLASKACVPCPAGFFSHSRGQNEECSPCPKGSYTTTEGNSRCAKCDEFQYQDSTGQQQCLPCPTSTRRFFQEVQVDGQVQFEETPGEEIDECKCVPGTWLPESVNHEEKGGLACVRCPAGGTCAGFTHGRQQIPVPKANYWGDPQHPDRFLECASGACDSGYQCQPGHSGRLCARPETGFFSVGRVWFVTCPANQSGRVLLILGGTAAVVIFWCMLSTWCSSNPNTLGIVLGFLQAFYILVRMRLRWHPVIEKAAAVLALLNYDVAFFGGECWEENWDGFSVYCMQLSLPFILTAISAIEYAVRRWFVEIRVNSSHPSRDKNVRSKGILHDPRYLPDQMSTFVVQRAVTFMTMMFHTLFMYALIPFVCAEEPDGKTQYLSWMPEVECWTDGHKAMRVISILYLILVLTAGPIYLCNVLWSAYKKDLLNLYGFMEQYGNLYTKYHCKYPCWEFVRVFRRTLLGCVLITVTVPMIQAVLAILIINLALCAHLVYKPMVHPHAANLEVAGLFTSLFMAVCGMLFFPSLDKTVECVGSSNLVGSIGSQCDSNETLKLRLAVVLLSLIIMLLLLAIVLSVLEMHSRRLAEKTAQRMKEIVDSQRQRQVGREVQDEGSSSMRQQCATENSPQQPVQTTSADEDVQNFKTENSWYPVWNTSTCYQGLMTRLGLAKASAEHHETMVDQYTLRLCHMIQGYHLHWWESRISALDPVQLENWSRTGSGSLSGSGAKRAWDRVKQNVHAHKEELAYIRTDASLSKFATIFDHVSGFYVNDDLANLLRQISAVLPLVIDWLANSAPELRDDFAQVMLSLTRFTHKSKSNSFRDVVMQEYRAPVLHWLMRCREDQRRSFRVVFTAIASSSGLSSANLVNLGYAATRLGASPLDKIHPARADAEQSPEASSVSIEMPPTPIDYLARKQSKAGSCADSPKRWATASGPETLPVAPTEAADDTPSMGVADAGWGGVPIGMALQVASLDPVPCGEEGPEVGMEGERSAAMGDDLEISELPMQ